MDRFNIRRFVVATLVAVGVSVVLIAVLALIPPSAILWLLLAINGLIFIHAVRRRDEFIAAWALVSLIGGALMATGVVS